MSILTSEIKNTDKGRLLKLNLSKIIGFFLGIPFSWPGPPVYLFAFGCILFAFSRRPQAFIFLNSPKKFAIYLLIFIAILSNVIALMSVELDAVRVITTSFFFVLLMFNDAVDDRRDLLEGFTKAMLVWGVLVLVFAFYLGIYKYGAYLFTVPDYRLWGSEYFPDWPNYLAFMLSVAFMLNILLFRRPVAASVQLVAALLTTSRTPFLALGLLAILMFFTTTILGGFKKTILLVSVIILSAFLYYFVLEVNQDLIERFLVFEDRQEIYSFAIDLVYQSPLIGHGAILLDESIGFDGFPSFHNSYLDISVRHGIPALMIFVWILVPSLANLKAGGSAFFAVVLFFLIGAIFQNFLKHPHIIMLYIVLISSGSIFLNNETTK